MENLALIDSFSEFKDEKLIDRVTALKPFTRLDQSRNQDSHSGVGLGLSIALDTIRGHGGNLTLGHSKNLGGLEVKITIPT